MTAPHAPRADVRQVRELVARGADVALLDVRSPAEFETIHIPGSVNLPLDQLDQQLTALAERGRPLMLVCRSGARATQAQTKLAAVGCVNATVLDGGVLAWEKDGAPVNRGAQKWDLERQVRLVAGGLVLTFVLVSIVVPPLRYVAGAVGAGLLLAALTNTCAMGNLLSRLPYNRGASCDVSRSMARLGAAASLPLPRTPRR
jgi:rhodanese-related sulfurtransferase